jgi:hypothetical protein
VVSPSPEVDVTKREAALIERLASAECVPWRGPEAPTRAAVEGAVRCQPDEGAAAELTLLAYSGPDALRDAWDNHLDAIQPSLDETSSACQGSSAGVRRWGFGSVACRVEDGSATIAWTDSRSHLLGVAQGSGNDIETLFRWWQDDAKILGRRLDADASPGRSGSDRPFVRVPGAPNDVVCSSLDEPIVDPHGRTWHLQRVRFVDGPDYERVVLSLERAGRARAGQSTEVTVERMPVAALATEFPGAPRPKNGRTALVVRMEGVTQALALRAYRPGGLELVRELSIVRGDRSRTAILSLNGDGCYQVRVPVFGVSAPTGADQAEVFIDVPR